MLPPDIRTAIHESLLACDIVGMHTPDMCTLPGVRGGSSPTPRSTRRAATVRYQGRTVQVRAYPISVDPAEFERLAASEAVIASEPRVLEARPEKMVLRVDRTDPSKNIVRGFRAFDLFLLDHPEWRGRVTMLALLDPSRPDIPEYAEYVGAIQRVSREVNDRHYMTGLWQPIDLRMSDNFPEAVAAYKHYDVLLVNAIFDGMNLVAKEAPLVNERDGVLILSENAGAYGELKDYALTVNPFDIQEQADAIYAALTMPAEERHRASRASARRCASTTSRAGSTLSWPTSRTWREAAVHRFSVTSLAVSEIRMIDVGDKPVTRRTAIARGRVLVPAAVLERIAARTLPKGDVLAVAQVAGIMAAKHTPDIVPLCHPLPLSKVDVLLELDDDGVVVTATAETTAQTGVEMEALTAVMAAALTVYDMTKGLDPAISIASAELVEKTGGKSGHWRRDQP